MPRACHAAPKVRDARAGHSTNAHGIEDACNTSELPVILVTHCNKAGGALVRGRAGTNGMNRGRQDRSFLYAIGAGTLGPRDAEICAPTPGAAARGRETGRRRGIAPRRSMACILRSVRAAVRLEPGLMPGRPVASECGGVREAQSRREVSGGT
jgi:hypothetical protein